MSFLSYYYPAVGAVLYCERVPFHGAFALLRFELQVSRVRRRPSLLLNRSDRNECSVPQAVRAWQADFCRTCNTSKARVCECRVSIHPCFA